MTTLSDSSVPFQYRVHPPLDPRLPANQPAIAKMYLTAYRRIKQGHNLGDYFLRVYRKDPGGADNTLQELESYFHDADLYLDDLLRLLPERIAFPLRPLPRIRRVNNIRELFLRAFEERVPRLRYEAQRKLYLAKLLFDSDHCRSIRDAPQHKEHWDNLLDEILWAEAEKADQIEICAVLEHGMRGRQHLAIVPTRDATDVRCWKFPVRSVASRFGKRKIQIYHYRSRFKRAATPAPDLEVKSGFWQANEMPRWPGLGRRSGSIVSKMIRRGIADPRQIQDVIGAMFIVGDRHDAYSLERKLVHAFGGPFRWRDRVDTLTNERDRGQLDTNSGSGFRVLKEIADILIKDPASPIPYFFSVEVQIYPVEDYLRTLYDAHFASHTSYKRRQFLRELLPLLFPPYIYGDEIKRLTNGDDVGHANENAGDPITPESLPT